MMDFLTLLFYFYFILLKTTNDRRFALRSKSSNIVAGFTVVNKL